MADMRRQAAALLCTLAFVASAGRPAAPADEVEEGFVGLLLSIESLDLAPEFEGRLAEVRVRIGDEVRAGGVLATLDGTATVQELRRAQAELDEATATRDKAATELEMAEELYERRTRLEGVFSAEQVRRAEEDRQLARINLEIAEAGVERSSAVLRQLENRRRQLALVAPFDGTVSVRYLDPGMTAGPATPVLRVIGDRGLWVRFAVPVQRAGSLSVSQPVSVRTLSPDLAFRGTIRNISSEVNAASGMIFCEATVSMPDRWTGPALPGREARVFPLSADESEPDASNPVTQGSP